MEDAMVPPTSNDSPTSPNQGVNVGNIVTEGSPHQMVGDVVCWHPHPHMLLI